MPPATSPSQALVARVIDTEVAWAVQRGSRQGIVVGGSVTGLLVGAAALGKMQATALPITISLAATLLMVALYLGSQDGHLSRRRLQVVLLTFVSLPTIGFLGSEVVLQNVMATYLPGVFQVTYGYLVALTALMLDARLSRLAGWVAGVQFLACALYAAPRLGALVATSDPVLRQDMTSPGLWLIKASLVVATGYLAAVLSSLVRRLTRRIYAEKRDKDAIERLFGQYVSPEVRERIVRDKAGTVGERRTVAVLFADIRGFTAYGEHVPPEVLVTHLNAYFDAMVEAITRHGGTVDKFIGDAVMAVFGGVVELDSPAAAALRAALDMRVALAELNARRHDLQPLDNGIGLHFGVVLQGPIGSRDRKDFTVIGDTVNTAARLETACKDLARPIVASGEFVAALPAELAGQLQLHGTLDLRGRQQPVEVWVAG